MNETTNVPTNEPLLTLVEAKLDKFLVRKRFPHLPDQEKKAWIKGIVQALDWCLDDDDVFYDTMPETVLYENKQPL